MGFEEIIEKVAESAAVPLAELLYKLLSKQLTTPDDVGQALARVAVDAGIESEDLARYVTDAGAKRAEEAVALAGAALYPPGETP